MSYSFKDEVEKGLPSGSKMVRMFSMGEKETSIEVLRGPMKVTLTMTKVDISKYFGKTPIVKVVCGETYNDLYARISEVYGLGLELGIDYYNSSPIDSCSDGMKYITLPISKDSYGYYGSFSVYVSRDPLALSEVKYDRNLSGHPQEYVLSFLKFKSHLVSQIFTSARPIFVENRLSIGFVIDIMMSAINSLNGKTEFYREELIAGIVIDTFSDGISDIALVKLRSGSLVSLRFRSEIGDLPIIKNNDDSDHEIDNSEEGSIGSGNSESENPGDGEGDLNIPNGSEDPNSDTEGNLDEEEDMDIDL